MKKNKGFTLAELLIVIAIIAVLIGITIPVFTAELEKAKEATDAANIRNAYAEASTSAQLGKSEIIVTVILTQTVKDWQSADLAASLAKIGCTDTPLPGQTIEVAWDGTKVVYKFLQ